MAAALLVLRACGAVPPKWGTSGTKTLAARGIRSSTPKKSKKRLTI